MFVGVYGFPVGMELGENKMSVICEYCKKTVEPMYAHYTGTWWREKWCCAICWLKIRYLGEDRK